MTEKRFVILDRDGTVIVERNYLSDPDEVELIPGTAEGLRKLKDLGLGLVVVTNQSGIGRSYFDDTRLSEIHKRMTDMLALEGITLDGIYFCPHLPESDCSCRKPKTKLAHAAAEEHSFDPGRSIVIGDKACDIELGRNLGATTILVRTGYGRHVDNEDLATPDFVADDLCHAAKIICTLVATDKEDKSNAITC